MKAVLALCVLLCPLLAGCGGVKLWGGPSAELTATSGDGKASLRPRFTTVVYRAADESTIDVYFTDLPLDRLADASDRLEGVSGCVAHVSMFLQPGAGSTPIDPTACSGAVRYLIVSDGAMGLYAGGGFITSDEPGKERLSGSVRGGSARLVRSTADFNDLLGPVVVVGKFNARYDDEACRAMAQRLQDASLGLPAFSAAPSPGTVGQR